MRKKIICPYCGGELQLGTIESVHAIYWCPFSSKASKAGIFLPQKRKGAQLISHNKLFFYLNAQKCLKCDVIIVDPLERLL